MLAFPGTPGTLTGFVLRILQCVFAAGSIASMATSVGFYNFTAFCYVIASMGLQVTWSLMLALLDAYALVTATLSLAAASASGGVAVLFFSDLGHCSFGNECRKFQISVVLAFLSWITVAISALIMLWILAAV
ncbi:CASP-like protein 5B3 isoform X2 [Cucumis melo]|uniref:CASP-like protein n=1 Tax=Cucumis melo TaxID=3656 RepID=A0A1S3CE32_CUCME|nr:CASP-like protein 5B3 isoform X2 [Cucumis melo]